MEKKYSDVFKDIVTDGVVAKWTGNCSVKNQEKKIRSAMMNLDSGKLMIKSFFETVVRNGINIMDLCDDGE